MKKLSLAVIFFASVFFISSCASSPISKERIDIPADIAGIVHSGRTRTTEEYALLNRLGSNWTLITFTWSTIESSQDQWDFSYHDEFVDAANAAGVKIIGVLAYHVSWIYEEDEVRRYIPPDKLDFYLDYVRKTAEHFRGRVDAWCIWNEPNTTHFWNGNKEDFFPLSRQAADAVREVDSEVVLLGGAVTRGVFGLPKKFIKGLFESGAMENTDAFAFHPYELNPARTLSLYAKFRNIVDDYGFGDKIWVTEVGYPTGGWYPTKVKEKNFPEYIVKTFVNLAVAGAPKILWYQLFDPQDRDKESSESFFGLVRSTEDYTSKGAEAFRLCAVYLAGTAYCPDLPQRKGLPKSLKSFYFEKPDDGGTLVLWNDGIGTKQIHLRLPGTDHAMHDPVSGIASPIQAETVIEAGKMPVFITWKSGSLPNGSGGKPEIMKK